MVKGLVVSNALGTRFKDYTGTVADAEVAMGVCGNVFTAATEICSNGFVPVSSVSYNFTERQLYINFANETYLEHNVYLEKEVGVLVATRNILQEVLLPALTTSKFVAG